MAATSLYEVFMTLPDPRRRQGLRHTLPAILAQATVAILSGARSLSALAQFGRDRGQAFARAVGCGRKALPCAATFHNVFKALPAGAFEEALGQWLAGRAQAAGWQSLSLDGKTLCGATGAQLPGVHLLAAYAHQAQATLAQMQVGAKTNEHKAALAMLEILPLEGKLVLGDALFCQRDLSREVCKKKATICGRSRTTSPRSSRKS